MNLSLIKVFVAAFRTFLSLSFTRLLIKFIFVVVVFWRWFKYFVVVVCMLVFVLFVSLFIYFVVWNKRMFFESFCAGSFWRFFYTFFSVLYVVWCNFGLLCFVFLMSLGIKNFVILFCVLIDCVVVVRTSSRLSFNARLSWWTFVVFNFFMCLSVFVYVCCMFFVLFLYECFNSVGMVCVKNLFWSVFVSSNAFFAFFFVVEFIDFNICVLFNCVYIVVFVCVFVFLFLCLFFFVLSSCNDLLRYCFLFFVSRAFNRVVVRYSAFVVCVYVFLFVLIVVFIVLNVVFVMFWCIIVLFVLFYVLIVVFDSAFSASFARSSFSRVVVVNVFIVVCLCLYCFFVVVYVVNVYLSIFVWYLLLLCVVGVYVCVIFL